MSEKVRLMIPLEVLSRMRVMWFNGAGWIRGHVAAIYSDGTCDLLSDAGNTLKYEPVQRLIAEK